jgi:AcrR family transcriptional regulator
MVSPKDVNSPRSRLIAGMAKVLEQQALSELYADDVVREAGVSKRTFYQHFANKEDCFLALYRENSARVLEVLASASGSPGLSALERIQLGAKAYLAFMQSQATLMKRLYIDILYLGTEGMKAKREVLQQFAHVLLAAYEEERALAPSLPPLAPELVLAIVAGINELILFKIEDGQADRLSDLESVSQQLILGQLLLSQNSMA